VDNPALCHANALEQPEGRPVSAATPATAAPGLALVARWRALQARERLALSIAVGVVGLALLWTLAVQPAWRTLTGAPPKIERLEAEIVAMQALAAEARAAAAQPPLTAAQSSAALAAAAARLGPQARFAPQGDRAVLMLERANRRAVQEFLAEARASARARVVEARLQAGPEGLAGTLVLALGGAAP
jgi:general secretion pathway protein M